MTKQPKDKTPPPPGGRAAERLRMFQDARKREVTDDTEPNRSAARSARAKRKTKGGNARKTGR